MARKIAGASPAVSPLLRPADRPVRHDGREHRPDREPIGIPWLWRLRRSSLKERGQSRGDRGCGCCVESVFPAGPGRVVGVPVRRPESRWSARRRSRGRTTLRSGWRLLRAPRWRWWWSGVVVCLARRRRVGRWTATLWCADWFRSSCKRRKVPLTVLASLCVGERRLDGDRPCSGGAPTRREVHGHPAITGAT
jgi:hypothetical protein